MSTVLARMLIVSICITVAGCSSRGGKAEAGVNDPQAWRDNLHEPAGLMERFPALVAPEPKIERVFTVKEGRSLIPLQGVEDAVYATEYAIRGGRNGIVEFDRKTIGKSLIRYKDGKRGSMNVDNQSRFVSALGGMLYIGLHQRSLSFVNGNFIDNGFRVVRVEKVEGVLFPLAVGNRMSVVGEAVLYNGNRISNLDEFVVLEQRDGYAGNGIEIGGEIWVIERTSRFKPLGANRWASVDSARLYWSATGNFVIGEESTTSQLGFTTGVTLNEIRIKEIPLYFVVGREDAAAKRDADRFSSSLNTFLAGYAKQHFQSILALDDAGGTSRPPAASPAQAPAAPRTAAAGGALTCDNSAGSTIANALIGAGLAALMGGGRTNVISSASNNAVKYMQLPGC